MGHHQVVELAADGGHARSFLNRAVLIKLPVTGEGICLQNAAEVGQMALRMFSLAMGGSSPCQH